MSDRPDRPLGVLADRLEERLPELERVTLARIYGVADPASVDDPGYVLGLRAAVSAALAYGISGVDDRAERPAPAPPELTAQARLAARNGVPLDTVLRRYFAGYTLLGDFVLQAAEEAELALRGAELRQLWRSEAILFDRLVSSIAAEHTAEVERRLCSGERRRIERVRRLLDGELLDPSELGYEFDAWHLGAIASGPRGPQALRDVAARAKRRLLLVPADGEIVWAWLGGKERLSSREAVRLANAARPLDASLALGEPGRGVEGWRQTHRQARAALQVALKRGAGVVAYADVALLASALQNETLADSLRELYLTPLEREDGPTLRRTLSAYFASGRNASSAAAALGVSRQTVNTRLRTVEEAIGGPLADSAAELETALRLHELEGLASHRIPGLGA